MADTLIPATRGKELSAAAKKILPALKFNPGDAAFKFLNGTRSTDPQVETRFFQMGDAKIRVMDFAGGKSSVHVENMGDITHVEYNPAQQSLLTIKKSPDRPAPEALATYFVSDRKLNGHEAVSSVLAGGPDGVDAYPGYAKKPSLETIDLHERLSALFKPGAAPAPAPDSAPKDKARPQRKAEFSAKA